MAKLNAPLFSFSATGKLADALVYFAWKGLNVVRSYAVPANPKTTAQTTHRGYLTEAVTAVHAAQALAAQPLAEDDTSAYSLWASISAKPRTWFNQICKNNIDQRVAALRGAIYRAGLTTPGALSLAVEVYFTTVSGANSITAGNFHYGTSKTALINTQAATVLADKLSATIAGLTAGVKYYWQFRPSAHADYAGAYSGIYYGVPTA